MLSTHISSLTTDEKVKMPFLDRKSSSVEFIDPLEIGGLLSIAGASQFYSHCLKLSQSCQHDHENLRI